jgi:hypothetical protein
MDISEWPLPADPITRPAPPRMTVEGGFRSFAETPTNGEVAPLNEPARAGGSTRRGLRIVDGVMRGSR